MAKSILIAPSGAGKNAIIQEALKADPKLRFTVSCTTREPRSGERDGRDYYFTPRAEFEHMIREKGFAEYATVHGEYYGTTKAEIFRREAGGHDLILDLDYQGARQIKAKYRDVVCIFILPPSVDEHLRRMGRDGTTPPNKLRRRIETSLVELGVVAECDAVVVNDKLDGAVRDVLEIIRRYRELEKKADFSDFRNLELASRLKLGLALAVV